MAEEIIKIPGIIGAVTRTDLLKGSFAPTPVNMKILNNFHRKRSGHIHVIADQFRFFAYAMETTPEIAAIHASPWTYDSYVPLFLAGYNVPAQRIVRPVHPLISLNHRDQPRNKTAVWFSRHTFWSRY